MNLSAPTVPVFVISLILFVLALVGFFLPTVPYLHHYDFWVAILAWVVLAIGTLMTGL